MTRNLTIPTVIKELARVSSEQLEVDIFTYEGSVASLVRDLAVKHAFSDLPVEIAGQLTIDEADATETA